MINFKVGDLLDRCEKSNFKNMKYLIANNHQNIRAGVIILTDKNMIDKVFNYIDTLENIKNLSNKKIIKVKNNIEKEME